MYETEQKFKLPDPSAFLAKIAELGAAWTVRVEEEDTYYQHPSRDFALTDEAFRIRRRVKFSGDNQESPIFQCFVTYKGPRLKTETKTRPEIELPLAFPLPENEKIATFAELAAATQPWHDLLTALGFRALRPVRKTRKKAWLTWDARRVEISYDDVPPTGKWAELEILVPDLKQLSAAETVIRTLAAKLGLTQPERRSYLELVMEADEEK